MIFQKLRKMSMSIMANLSGGLVMLNSKIICIIQQD